MRDLSTETKAKYMHIQSVSMDGIGLRDYKGGLKDNKVTKLPKLSGLGPSCTYFSILLTLMLLLMLHSSGASFIKMSLRGSPDKSEHLNLMRNGSSSSPLVKDTCSGPLNKSFTGVMDNEIFDLAALGRPLSLGMLYDMRKHSLITGINLWDEELLKKNLGIHTQPQTDLKISSSDSLSDKCSLLDVSASLKLSFMSGLVEVEGSARYLHDTKFLHKQSRVTMHYRETTRFEQLTMSQLSHFTYPKIFEQKTATHVVTAVLYGAQAFMVFDRKFSEDENKQTVDGELNVMVKKIPQFTIEGKGNLDMTESDKRKADNINCTFHGDFRLEQNPITYMEALDVYKQLPTLLKKNNGSGVPIKVWLYPLSLLDEQAARLVREISTSLVSYTEAVMEELGEAERRCNDLFRKTHINVFSDIKERVLSFQSSIKSYKTRFINKLRSVLPAIRGGEMEEQALEEILENHNESPFIASKLYQWLDYTYSEIGFLSSYTKSLNMIRIVDLNGLNKILINSDIDVVVCLALTSLRYEDPYLSKLKEFLKSENPFYKYIRKITPLQSVASIKNWFDAQDIIVKMRENMSRIKNFSEANKYNKKIRFIISAISDPSSPGSSIYLYEKGNLTDKQFQPIFKPPRPIVNVHRNTVSIIMSKFPAGEKVQYRVEYKEVKPEEKEEWLVENTSDEDFTLTGLESGKQYLIRYRIVSQMGMGEASDTISAKLSSGHPLIVGGRGGLEFTFINDAKDTIQSIHISYQKDYTLSTIQVNFHNGQKIRVGKIKGYTEAQFVFDESDKIIKATLWPNSANNRAGGFEFVVEKINGKRVLYSVKCNHLGKPVSLDVKSGKCNGIIGRSGHDIDALGFYFI